MNDKTIKPVTKAVLPVAGLGTRFLPATKVIPKEMIPLVDKPLIEHAYDEALEAGITDIIFVNSPHKPSLEKHFERQEHLQSDLKAKGKKDLLALIEKTNLEPGRIQTVIQEEALGFGHAIWCARELVDDEPFAIILPDDIFLAKKGCMAQMVEAYNDIGGNMVAVTDVDPEDTGRYGIVDIEKDMGKTVSIRDMVEKPDPKRAPSHTAIMGRYILQPEVFTHLSNFEKGAGGEIQLTDAMLKLIGEQSFHGFRYDGQRYDCGTRAGFIEATVAYALFNPEFSDKAKDVIEKFYNQIQSEKHDKRAAAG